jgi:ribonuclease-3
MLPVDELESRLGYRFVNRQLLIRALTHRSRASELIGSNENTDNEQLEFLGDAVLGFIVSEALVEHHPEAREGELSQLKSHLVRASHLHRCAIALGIGEFLLLGKGEERSGGRERRTLLADGLEAVIGAIHLDGGIEAARHFVHCHIVNALEIPGDIEAMNESNHKSVLQERARALGLPVPRYITVDTMGPEHAKVFVVEGRIGERYSARGSATSKKAASQQAAAELLAQMSVVSS